MIGYSDGVCTSVCCELQNWREISYTFGRCIPPMFLSRPKSSGATYSQFSSRTNRFGVTRYIAVQLSTFTMVSFECCAQILTHNVKFVACICLYIVSEVTGHLGWPSIQPLCYKCRQVCDGLYPTNVTWCTESVRKEQMLQKNNNKLGRHGCIQAYGEMEIQVCAFFSTRLLLGSSSSR